MSSGKRINQQRYRVECREKLGAGSFGEIFRGYSVTDKTDVAVKFEKLTTKAPQLYEESQLYLKLSGNNRVPGIPHLHWYGSEGNYNILVMDLLGPSLETIFNCCDRKFSLKTVFMLADQFITRLEYVHSNNYIHRDVKPD
ncbi:MAG: putative casein kinase 1, partial [Streblomastix strix]